uniref:Uncharacterized protein n=1 Tax=Rhizophora mucronata TaxID=61149 RepID=A0A2P2NLN5_RHIMU
MDLSLAHSTMISTLTCTMSPSWWLESPHSCST